MSLVVAVVLLIAAAGLLAGGAELFAEHAAAAGHRLGVTGLAVGLLLAGAEPEELVTAVLAALRGQPGIAAGDAVGANVTLLTLLIGVLALLHPLTLDARVGRYAAGAAVASGAAWWTLTDGHVSPAEGVALLGAYVVLVALVWRLERQPPAIGELAELAEAEGQAAAPTRGLLLALAGVVVMTAGGWLAVTGAERLVGLLAIAGSVVGLTVVALATTAEFVALIPAALRRGVPQLALAGIIGSVAYNATVTLGAAAIVQPLRTGGIAGAASLATALAATIALVAGTRRRLGRVPGLMLVAGYIAYVWRLWG